jgi:general secretion pathway protein L
MTTLVVLLPREAADAATEFEYALSPDGRGVESHGRSQPALLPQPGGAGAEVVAVVPVQSLAWHRVDLPRGMAAGSPRLRAALDGLLEEQLLDEAEALHFALPPQVRAGEAWVAACDRAWLRAALQVLEQAGRPVSRIVPEFAPQSGGSLYAIGEGEQALWVATGEHGVLALPMTASATALFQPLPEETARIAEPAVAGLAEQLLAQKLELQQPAQRGLQAARSGWDLAQFEFASSGRARAMKKLSTGWAELLRAREWRPARWGAALLVAVNLVGLNAWAWKERATLQAKRDTIRTTLTSTFPSVKVVVDPRVQMEREVAALRQVTGVASGRDFETLLAALAGAAPPGHTPAGLEFAPGELRVRGMNLSADEAASLAGNLKSVGVTATAQGDTLLLAPEDVR